MSPEISALSYLVFTKFYSNTTLFSMVTPIRLGPTINLVPMYLIQNFMKNLEINLKSFDFETYVLFRNKEKT